MIKLTIGERLKDERVNNNLTIQQVCDKLKEKYNFKLSVGKLNEMESDEDKDFGYRAFVYLSKLYKVSTDYLLGRTEAKTTDVFEREMCDYTGLSEKSLRKIFSMNMTSKDLFKSGGPIDVLNYLLEGNYFHNIIIALSSLVKASDDAVAREIHYEDDEENYEDDEENYEDWKIRTADDESNLIRYRISELTTRMLDEFDRRSENNTEFRKNKYGSSSVITDEYEKDENV